MLRRRSASRAPTHAPTQDPHRPLLAPLHTHFSSPETRYTRSPGSIDERVTTHREPTIEGMSDGEQSGGRDHVQRGRDELGKLASGMDAAVDSPFPDARRSAEFRRHANTSLHSLLSRHGTLLEHHPADSGPPTASTSAYPTGHIVAPGSASSSDWTDLDALKPPRNADDEHLARGRQLFTSPEEQARENERIVGRMHRWMDELVVMQEGIAALHMKLEGVGMDGEGFEGKAGEAERGEDGKETTPSDGKQARDEAEEKREDHIMDEMIEQVGPSAGCHNLALTRLAATPTVRQTSRLSRDPAPDHRFFVLAHGGISRQHRAGHAAHLARGGREGTGRLVLAIAGE